MPGITGKKNKPAHEQMRDAMARPLVFGAATRPEP
jgi:hypothetical protein